MDDSKKVKKQNYLSEEAIKVFIFSNILHSIDNDYLKLDIEKVNVNVSLSLDKERYDIIVQMEKNGAGQSETFSMPYAFEDKLDQLRSMMGLTMKILGALALFAKDTPILRIVK